MLFTFPSRYWFTIGLSVVFSLTGWSPQIQPEILVLRPTQVPTRLQQNFKYGTVTLYGRSFQIFPLSYFLSQRWSYNPATRIATPTVWAVPRSLATTRGIVFTFFSCGYLDVSVPHVRLRIADNRIASVGLPHSEIYGSRSICLSP